MRYGAFLRAVNVGGTGKLPMADLRRICEESGFSNVVTYIASGNVAFDSDLPTSDIISRLNAALEAFAGKPVGVFLRNHDALTRIATDNPFAEAKGNQVTAILLEGDAHGALAMGLSGQSDERVQAGDGVIYVHYPSGMARSKLRLIGAAQGTARNMNTIAKMVQLTA